MDGDVQLLAPFQKIELDHEAGADQRRAEPLHQRGRGGGGAAGGENIVDDDDAVAGGQRVVVDLQHVAAVFELVLVAARGPRELAGLADGDEAGAEDARDAAAEDEAARLDGDDVRHALAAVRLRERVARGAERLGRAQEWRDVLEENAGLRKIGNVADVVAKLVRGHGQNFTSKSPSFPLKSRDSLSIFVTSA